MRSLLFTIACLLAAVPALAQERGADSAPPETVSMVYVAIFAIVFIGMIVGFFVYLWWGERGKKSE